MLFSLLSEVLTASWDAAQFQADPHFRASHVPSALSYDYSCYTVAPPLLSSNLVANALTFLTTIKPNTTLKAGLRAISNTLTTAAREGEDSQEFLLLTALDKHIQTAIHYFSASNWNETYSVVYKVLDATVSGTPNQSTDSDLIPGIELFGILYLDAKRVEIVLSDFYKFAPRMRLPLHRLLIENFLQKSLVYWTFSGIHDLANLQNSTALIKTAENLFDYIYSCSDDERRRFSSWRFLGTLITLIPSSFELYEQKLLALSTLTPISSSSSTKKDYDYTQTAPTPTKKMSSKFRVFSTNLINNSTGASARGAGIHTHASASSLSQSQKHASDKAIQKKMNFLACLNKLGSTSPSSPLFSAYLISCTEILKAAATVSIAVAENPLIRFAKRMYPILLSNLFPAAAPLNPMTAPPDIHSYQCTFVSSYTVLCSAEITKDIYPMLQADDPSLLCYAPSILEGTVHLRLMPSFVDSLSRVVTDIFPLFRETLIRTVKLLNYFESQPNLDAPSAMAYKTCVTIILKCYFIFTLNPEHFLTNYSYSKHFEDDPIFFSVAHSVISTNEDIRRTTFAFAWSFLDKENLVSFDPDEVAKDPEHQVYTLFLHLGKLSQILVEKVTRSNMIESDVIEHLALIKGLMEGRCLLAHQYQFSRTTKQDISKIEPADIRFEISSTLEMSMLFFILSSNTKICKLALEVLNFMVQEAVITEDLEYGESFSWSIVSNFSVYSELSSPSYVITGSMAVHKRLYHALQGAKANTTAILQAWRIIYDKWLTLTASIQQKTYIDTTLTKRWRAYSGFLASTVSAWIVEKDEPVIEGKLSNISKTFLLQILMLLTNVKSSYLRETAREILSRDTNHFAYHFIFTTLEEKITRQLTKNQADLNEEDFLLLEQSVSLLRAIIEYINDGEVYLAVDITSLALSIVKKLNGLAFSERVTKLRIQYASLMSSISKHKDSMNMKHDLVIRNEVAFIFSNWLDHSISIAYSNDETESIRSNETSRASHEKERLHKDCIVALVESLSTISLKLIIEAPGHAQGRELYEIKSHKFSVIFMLLVRVLEKCRAEESHQHNSLSLGDRLETVKNKTIECASKLLDANVDVGLKLALPLGMHQDSFIRMSFIKILDNILSHNSASDLESEDAAWEQLADLLNENIKIVIALGEVCPATEVDEFANTLLAIFESRGNTLGLVKALITREVERADTPMEILRRNCLATKLLSIYAHTKGIAYLKEALAPFIKDICDSPEQYAFETNPDKLPPGQTVEENIVRFERTLTKLVTALEESLLHIPRDFRELCHTIAEAAESRYLGKNASVNAISAFFFLRFLCPSLVAPEAEGVVDRAPPREVRRTLLILAKMVQNLAYGSGSLVKLSIFKNSNVNFKSDSESVVRILKSLTGPIPLTADSSSSSVAPNDLLSLSGEHENASGSSVATASAGEPSAAASLAGVVPKAVDRATMEKMHRFLYSHWEDINHKLQNELRKARQVASGHQRVSSNHKNTLLADPLNRANYMSARFEEESDFRARQKLTMLIRNLGRPKSSETKPEVDSAGGVNSLGVAPRLREFLARNAHRDMQPIIEKRIFHEGLSKEGMPLLIFTAQNYVRDAQDTELIVCRFFQIASKMWNQKFALFFDATGSTAENIMPLSARSVINLMIPDIMATNCVASYFYNVPAEMIGYLRGMYRIYLNGKYLNPLTTRYRFITSFDISDRFNLATLGLDSRSLRVVTDARLSFDNVERINPEKRDAISIVLKIGTEYVQFVGQDSFMLIKGATGVFNSVYHFSEINNVELSPTNRDEFFVSVSRGGKRRIILRSTRANEIVRALVNAKARLPKSSVSFATDSNAELYQTLDSSIGSLLSVSFAGLCSEDSAARSAAYNLLATVQARFKLNLGVSDMLRGRGLRLPANVFNQVGHYSRAVADNYPELAHDMVSELFSAYKAADESRSIGTLTYITPWIKHLGTHIYKLEPAKYKRGTTASFIRQFLEISFARDIDYMYSISTIWPLVLADPITMPILIDEFLALVLEKDLVFSPNIEDMISILTATRSLDAVFFVKEKIFEILQTAVCTREKGIADHPQWPEIVVLINILSAMLFENPDAAVAHQAEYCFLVHMLLYTGPYSFRHSLYTMMVNMVHSVISTVSISPESKSHAMTIWKDLTGDKGNMVFGTSEELKNVEFSYPVTSLLFQLDSYNAMDIELARSVTPVRQLEHQHDIFMQRCLNLCTQSFSTFQCRAIVTLGLTSRLDINDSMMTVVLNVLSEALTSEENNKQREELITCVAFSLSKMVNGLQAESKYYGYLFWVSIALMNTRNMEIFGHGLQLFLAALKCLDDYGVFKYVPMSQYLLTSKEEFKEQWEKLEGMLDMHFSQKYFELGVAATLLRGLVKSVTRADTLAAFDTLLTIAAKNQLFRDRESSIVATSKIPNLTLASDTASITSDGGSVKSFSPLSYAHGYSGSNPNLQSMHHSYTSPGLGPVGSSCGPNAAGSPGGNNSQYHFAPKMYSKQSSISPTDLMEGDDTSAASMLYARGSHPAYLIYLFFLFLGSRSQSDLRDYLWIAGFPEDYLEDDIPTPICKFIGSGRVLSVASLYLGGVLYSQVEDEEKLGKRFLDVMRFVGSVNLTSYLQIYFVIRPKVKRTIDVFPSVDLVKGALECAKVSLLNYEELKRPRHYLAALDEILAQAGLGPSKCTGGFINNSAPAFVSGNAVGTVGGGAATIPAVAPVATTTAPLASPSTSSGLQRASTMLLKNNNGAAVTDTSSSSSSSSSNLPGAPTSPSTTSLIDMANSALLHPGKLHISPHPITHPELATTEATDAELAVLISKIAEVAESHSSRRPKPASHLHFAVVGRDTKMDDILLFQEGEEEDDEEDEEDEQNPVKIPEIPATVPEVDTAQEEDDEEELYEDGGVSPMSSAVNTDEPPSAGAGAGDSGSLGSSGGSGSSACGAGVGASAGEHDSVGSGDGATSTKQKTVPVTIPGTPMTLEVPKEEHQDEK